MNRVLLYLVLCISIQFSFGIDEFPNFFRRANTIPVNKDEDNGDPLILTKYIEEGRIQEAKDAARVQNAAFLNVEHYSGFFTVNETFNSNLFFWFCPSESDPLNDPVVLWLQGGPGGSSLFGLFTENGPFEMISETEAILRDKRWTRTHSMIYIDNPAGTGYSYTDDGGLAHDEDQIGRELYRAIDQFFILFSDLRANAFFISGESYAGHYIPAISSVILRENNGSDNDRKINLQGIAIGNGWTDPINQMNYGEYLYQHGIVDLKDKEEMDSYKEKATQLIIEERYSEARDAYYRMLFVFVEATHYTNIYNYLNMSDNGDSTFMDAFVQSSEIRRAIHVGNLEYHDGSDVNTAMKGDVMKSVVHLLPEIIHNCRVLLFSGQVDIIVAYPLSVHYLEKLKFSSSKEYRNARRTTWYVNDEIAGFVKVAGNLTDILVRNAGHMVPTDEPTWAYDLIYRFTRNRKFDVAN